MDSGHLHGMCDKSKSSGTALKCHCVILVYYLTMPHKSLSSNSEKDILVGYVRTEILSGHVQLAMWGFVIKIEATLPSSFAL